ncbi:SDR family oxidoreductase [Terrilactibacillus laevilacticus]|uniref:SDR family oxidoreductase n=1 Tax=Terrilactibacillus laevilacticus TaxID=1380157 RepID=UPI0011470959|nr:SDR family oxidoreductase [Terrilactibacillus laevilacticus]
MNLNLQGKVALVIASSQGLGKAIATELVKEGANVMLTSRDETKLAHVHKQLLAYESGQVAYCKADITKMSDITNLIEKTHQAFGKIDILINNGGGPPAGTFDDFSDQDWQKAFELNLLSYIRLTRAVLPDLKQSGGHIMSVVSSSVKQPIPGLILSNTIRTGVIGLMKTLAEELAPYNILVNTVAPGRIDTDRVKSLDQKKADETGLPADEVARQSKEEIPLNRYGTPEEFGRMVAFMVSSGNTYMTGQTFLIDGGAVKVI